MSSAPMPKAGPWGQVFTFCVAVLAALGLVILTKALHDQREVASYG